MCKKRRTERNNNKINKVTLVQAGVFCFSKYEKERNNKMLRKYSGHVKATSQYGGVLFPSKKREGGSVLSVRPYDGRIVKINSCVVILIFMTVIPGTIIFLVKLGILEHLMR